MKQNILLIILTIFSLYSCKHNTLVEDIPTKENCDSNTIDFVNEVLPILQSSCATTGCHNTTSHKEGVVLNNYSNIINTIGINKGNASSSKLYKVLNDYGDDLMPPSNSGIVLTQTQKNIIKDWINQGAKNIECTNTSDCDTTNFAFAANVKPLLEASCLSCHSSTNTSGGVSFSTYTDVKVTVDNGKLLNSIKHTSGTSAMPQGAEKWNDCKITIVEKWINDGAPNN